ncbi:hypothetical protein V1515DRAFT_91771 [Lipomyces mesembrius]
MLITTYMFMKALTFGIGFYFFAGPIITKSMAWLSRSIPDWPKYIEPRSTILRGVPTNAQLAITLLRTGEYAKAPIPPQPYIKTPPPDQAKAVDTESLQLGASDKEINEAIQPDADRIKERKNTTTATHGSKLVSFFKTITKVSVETVLAIDYLKAKFGAPRSKERLGMLPSPEQAITSGPLKFKARYCGQKGCVCISMSELTPYLSFMTEGLATLTAKEMFKVKVSDIKELKKIGALGWKSELVVGWALQRGVRNGLMIIDRDKNSYVINAIESRDELFNRLICLGGQNWEAC